MAAVIETESTLTDRYQTTVPEPVRRALKLGKRDKIRFEVRRNGEVVLSRAGERPSEDPVALAFLDFLGRDMQQHPERLKPLDKAFVRRVRALVRGVEVDLDAALPADEA